MARPLRPDERPDVRSALHRAWKEALVTAANPPNGNRPFALLDVAGGTGDIAIRVIGAGGAGTRATVCDINADMLEIGRERAAKSGLDAQGHFVEGNAEALPFPDTQLRRLTIAFGIRNVPRIDRALAEAYRVLKPAVAFSLPRILGRRRPRSRPPSMISIRSMSFRHSARLVAGDARVLSLSGGIHPPLSRSRRLLPQ